MKKTNPLQDDLERQIQGLLAPWPDPMGRTDFRKACRIGTRTSIYLLQSGLVPCENTGKQTRCYKIAKSDVAAYLRRLAEPAYYTPPSGWYKNYPNHKPPAFGLNGSCWSASLMCWTPVRLPRLPATPPAPSAAGAPRAGSRRFPTSTPIRRPKSGCWSFSLPRTTTVSRERASGITP